MDRIIVAEDQDDLRSLYYSFLDLKFPNLNIDMVEDGLALVDLVNKNKYNLIITDDKMPRMRGSEAITKIRADYPNIPIIMMSGDANEYDALEAGANAFIRKPFMIDEFFEVIDKHYTPK